MRVWLKSNAAQLQRKLLINNSVNKIAKKVQCERDWRDWRYFKACFCIDKINRKALQPLGLEDRQIGRR